ncbi:unnamed protein product [Cuscuta europaea]|uniref:Uncharacterized protein n=1 Tax=Cuscuta europaea TaxID=41803 RepID=A0A9P0YVW8_CUSEU|nr:unnamed protein product [Cuscuta europaea]
MCERVRTLEVDNSNVLEYKYRLNQSLFSPSPLQINKGSRSIERKERHKKEEGKMAKAKVFFFIILVAVAFLDLLCLSIVRSDAAGSSVKFLPGFDGPLPFQLETGYIGVGESEDVQLFYYFVKSESDPKFDPLFLWLNGGPGCSALSGLIYEIGPMTFAPLEYNGSLPTLISHPYSWTKVANIVFLDLPVGTGFSYATTETAHQSNPSKACQHAHEFLLKWLNDHQEFISNPFYVAGDSYSGQLIPIIGQIISQGNEYGISPQINMKGYILGNPLTFPLEANYKFPFAHGMGLISDELFTSLEKNCEGESYLNINPENVKCYNNYERFNQLTTKVNEDQILEAQCKESNLLMPIQKEFGRSRLLVEKSKNIIGLDALPLVKCRSDWYILSKYWANDESVRDALHVRKGSLQEWSRCNKDLDYVFTRDDVIPYHLNLSIKGYRSLVYSGDHDFVIPFLSTQAWIRSLNYSIIDEWRPWMVDDQIAGYTRSYSNKMTFATVKGGGHTAPEYKPNECLKMLRRWLSYRLL